MVEVPVSDRCKQYGYIFWRKSQDGDMKHLLGDATEIAVMFGESLLGPKNIDWRLRRISVGWKQTRTLTASVFKLRVIVKNGTSRLQVQCF